MGGEETLAAVAGEVTHAHRTVGPGDHLHGEDEILQVVAEQAEGFELLKGDALGEKVQRASRGGSTLESRAGYR